MEIEVKGHSGCRIDIVREDNNLFINKSSRDLKYLPRLVRQAEKQQAAGMYEYQHVRVPRIFAIEQCEDHVSVKMEYVYSKNFIEYFENAGFEQIDYLIKALIMFLERELVASPLQVVRAEMVKAKFEDVKRRISDNSMLQGDLVVRELMRRSEVVFDNCKDMSMPVGICHGDLTFSNILFNGNNYYLIDFLDSFVESPLLDIVKIRQDSAYGWSALMYTKPYDEIRLPIVCEKIDREIDAYFSKYDWYRAYYGLYQLMNFWRILQYGKEERVIEYLKRVIANILDKA